MNAAYIGRFAPTPSGPLHAGSMVAALASWLDARACDGTWLLRIEDEDQARCITGTDQVILRQLADCGLLPDAPPVYQSQRRGLYEAALRSLSQKGMVYRCTCSRKQIDLVLQSNSMQSQALQRIPKQVLGQSGQPPRESIYPGTCRHIGNTHYDALDQTKGAWRLRTTGEVERDTGDFVLKRADGFWSYQLAVVVDDAAQGVTHIVRGADLLDNTARQIYLQTCLAYPTPSYLHTPLVLAEDGEKLSKQNGAIAVDTSEPLKVLNAAAQGLGLRPQNGSLSEALHFWVQQWRTTMLPCKRTRRHLPHQNP